MRRFFIQAAMVVAIALGAIALIDPVPYSLSCFDTDRMIRSLCHRQMTLVKAQMVVRGLVFGDPKFLRDHRAEIEQGFDDMYYRNGFTSEELGTSPPQFRELIDDVLRQNFGRPI